MKKLPWLACSMVLLAFALNVPHLAAQMARAPIEPETVRLAARFQSGDFHEAAGTHLPYRYFDPGPQAASGGRVPIVLYLHGEDEGGTDNKAQVVQTECATVWMQPRHLAENPVYVLAPQLPKGARWNTDANYAATLALLRQFMASHPAADPDRIYLVGFSMGATGVYNLLLKNPKMFAAAMPIGGTAEPYLADRAGWAALRNTPIIILHSYDDTVVPVSAAINATAALQAGGNEFMGYGAPTPSLWSPTSTPYPHDAWWTAFHKFEVIYNSMFVGDLAKTHHGELSPTTVYIKRSLGDGITQVWDYALGTSIIVERPDKAIIIDTTMGHGGLYQFIRDNVLVNKDVPLEVFLTHQHDDHIRGLASFVGAAQLKQVYVNKEDSAPILKILGPDAGKVHLVKDGDLVPLGGSNVEVIHVPGHTAGSIVMKYDRYLFTGDSIGTGYIGVGAFSVEQYIPSLQHLLQRMGPGHYTIYGGHTGEVTVPMTETYVTDLLKCAQAIVANNIAAPVYWRGRDSALRRVSTVNNSSITYNFNYVHRIPGALRSLQISKGVLLSGYFPEFRPSNDTGFFAYNTLYVVNLDPSVTTLGITPTVLDPDDRSLTVNGQTVASGSTFAASLEPGVTWLPVTITAADGQTRTYTLKVVRAAP